MATFGHTGCNEMDSGIFNESDKNDKSYFQSLQTAFE